MKKPSCTGIILAGGENKRFNGKEKAFLRINGEYIIEHIMKALGELFDDLIVVTNSLIPYLEWNALIVKDIYPTRSSLTGIHAGLFYTRTPYAFITACDTPFIKQSLIQHFLDAVKPQYDVILPETRAGLEPLCAIYSKRCLPFIQKQLTLNNMKIQTFFQKLKVF